jgi:DNA-directed RNA polymerase I and III subunit RPAC1
MKAEIIRTRVSVGKETVSNISSTDFPGNWPGYDDTFDFEQFKKVKVKLINRILNL